MRARPRAIARSIWRRSIAGIGGIEGTEGRDRNGVNDIVSLPGRIEERNEERRERERRIKGTGAPPQEGSDASPTGLEPCG